MLKLNHKNLDVWRLAIKFVSKIYMVTAKYPKEELFGLTSQTRRAATSISANIAEGASRKRFFEISRSSLVEVDTHIEIAKELEFLGEKILSELEKDLNELFAKLSNFIKKAR